MRRLKLNLDDLQVESFETSPMSRRLKGTVAGYNDPFEQPIRVSQSIRDCLRTQEKTGGCLCHSNDPSGCPNECILSTPTNCETAQIICPDPTDTNPSGAQIIC